MRGLCVLAWMMLGCGLTYPTNPGARDATADVRGAAKDVVDAGPCGMPGQRCCPTIDGMDGGVVPDAGPQGNGCATGANCSNGVCMTCPAGRIVCNNDCVDPMQNANCGACGMVCAAGTACMRVGDAGVSSCQLVCPGQTACGGRCADTMTDPMNCGGCGRVCNAANATNTCVMGQCRFACNGDFANCDSMTATGCEANLQTDVNHCMTCGRRCQIDNATAACVMGQCRVGTCNMGFEDCDGDPANGCEANINTTVAHCGRCNNRCTSPAGRMSVCVNGGCGIAGDCAMPTADCDGNQSCETNTSTSPMHCGGCGRPCNSTGGTATCTNGVCGIVCSPGLGNCDNNASNGCEANTNTNVMHCGRCGGACNLPNATAACTGGTCVVMECRSGFADCDRNPANGCEQATTTDNANCGGCGIRCRGGETCTGGRCACSVAGTTHCPAANQCLNLTSDPNNCGMCGTVCGVTGQVCQMGTCLCPSSVPTTCGSACVNTQNDPNNCGSCGTRCMLANANSTCAAGQCVVVTCNANFGNCNGNNTDGCESDFRTDSNNCGRCGMQCGAGRFCSNGACVTCGSAGAPACPTGTACTSSTNCSGTCRDLQSDEANCGACGRACGAGQTCCSGVCRTLATDTSNCGMCGTTCPAPTNATAVCTTGACGITCNAGFANCNGNTTDGCEINTLTSDAHCGMCNRRCPTGQSCVNGSCTIACGTGQTLCGGLCVNTMTDTANCGMCGRICSSAGGTASCTGGTCGITCNTGFGNCDGNVTNGCEANFNTSASHCGGCAGLGGVACMSGQTCSSGVCCGVGLTNCGGMCVNTQTHNTHCGGCAGGGGTTCETGTQICSAGTCAACGATGQPCCSGAVCPRGGVCVSGSCVP